MKRAMLIAAAFWTVSTGTAWPMDQIYTSTSEKPFNGKIISMTATAISFDGKDGPSEIPANEITRIIFESSPDGLTTAQRDMLHGEYEKAIDALKKETTEDKRRGSGRRDCFLPRLLHGPVVLSGAADPVEAGKLMFAFIKNSPNSFHYLKACELMGDICVTLGKFTERRSTMPS